MSKKPDHAKRGRTARLPRRGGREVTSEEALQFIRRMQKAFPKTPRTRSERERLREYLAQFRDDLLKAVGSRVQSDIMLRRPQTVRRKDIPKAQPSRTVSRKKR